MKKIYIILALLLAFIVFTGNVEAVSIEVTESIPGANCSKTDSLNGPNGTTSIYTCNPGNGFDSVTNVLGAIVKYFTYITALAAVLFIVINGILYSMSGIDAGLKDGAKKRIIKTLTGLVILLLAGVILNAVAPWIYTA